MLGMPSCKGTRPDDGTSKKNGGTTDAQGNIAAEATRRITSVASKRIASTAFALAAQRAKKGGAIVTVIHKSNVLSVTDGLFRTSCRQVYDEEGWESRGRKIFRTNRRQYGL